MRLGFQASGGKVAHWFSIVGYKPKDIAKNIQYMIGAGLIPEEGDMVVNKTFCDGREPYTDRGEMFLANMISKVASRPANPLL